MDDISFGPPPFKPDEGLQKLQRELRALGLTARGAVFERRGLAMAQCALEDGAIQASVVKRPSRNSPEWTRRSLESNADIRDFVADLKRKLSTWSDRDD